MVFFNHCLPHQCILSAVVAMPFTISMIANFSTDQVLLLAKSLNLQTTFENIENPIELLRQTLRDVIYAAEDIPQLHIVYPCQSKS